MTTATATRLPRIDKLASGAFVTLDCAGRYEQRALFVGIVGEGDARRARFVSNSHGAGNGNVLREDATGYYEWEAYRYNGGWAFGTSAERLRVLEVC